MLTFPDKLLFIRKDIMYMANTVVTNNKQYKRQDRSVSPETAMKISSSLKSYNATHPRPEQWRKRISDGLSSNTGGYWSKIPPRKKEDGEGTTVDDLVL